MLFVFTSLQNVGSAIIFLANLLDCNSEYFKFYEEFFSKLMAQVRKIHKFYLFFISSKDSLTV